MPGKSHPANHRERFLLKRFNWKTLAEERHWGIPPRKPQMSQQRRACTNKPHRTFL
jgi:hypothetical protein